ncbi:hypothetical protein VTJ04DRAFT_3044 [Mycothermus thermophilus]|uniref:uncharacterized protein n=1 Tax=Humicola insolens TaxID=85995 RepID=UPI003742873D
MSRCLSPFSGIKGLVAFQHHIHCENPESYMERKQTSASRFLQAFQTATAPLIQDRMAVIPRDWGSIVHPTVFDEFSNRFTQK